MACKNCGCKEDLSVLNIRYDGEQLTCISIEEGDNLGAIFNNINDIICTLKDNLDNGVNIKNIGSGKKVFKGKDENAVNELRTFLGGTGIRVDENTDTIEISSVYQTTDLSFDANTNVISATFVDGSQKTSVLNFDETLTSISQDEGAGTITYIDEEGNPTVLNIGQGFDETLTQLVKQSGDLVYTDENGDSNTLELPKNTSDLNNDGEDGVNPFTVQGDNISIFNNDSGFITGFTELDPVFTSHPSFDITSQDIINWNNNAPNVTHTGQVTGDEELTITDNAVDNTKLSDMAINTIKGTDVGGDPKDLSAGAVRAMIGLDFGLPSSDGQVLQGDTDGSYAWTTIAGSTLDLVPTDGSTNGVESNGIFDALTTKAGLSLNNSFTGSNTFTGGSSVVIDNTSGSGLHIVPTTNNTYSGPNGAIWFDADKGINIGQGNGQDIIKFVNSNTAKRTYTFPDKSGTVALLDDLDNLGGNFDLSYVVSPTNGTINNSGGTNATVPLSSTINAGLMSPDNTRKVSNISVTQPVDLDTMESNVATNNQKISNAVHTGEVTGGTALTISNLAVTNSKIANNTIVASQKLTNSGVTSGTYNSVTVNSKGIVTSGTNSSTGNATTLDGIDSTQFLRSDVNDTANGVITFSSGSGNPIRLYGSNVGNTNVNTIPFYESNGIVRQGYIGFPSPSNSHLYLRNDVSDKSLILLSSGTLSYDDSISITGRYSGEEIRLSSQGDASLQGVSHAFQIGDSNGVNLIMDTNEIMARTNGSPSNLTINADGGTVSFGGSIISEGNILAEGNKNVLQTLSTSGNNLSITNGNTVALPQQSLSISGNTLSISSGNSVTLPSSGGGSGATQTSGTKTVTVNATGSYFQNGTSSATMYWTKTGNSVFFTIKKAIFSPGFSGIRSGSLSITGLQHEPIRDSAVSIYDGVNPSTLSVSQNAVAGANPARITVNVAVKGDGGTNYGSRTITYDFSGTYITN